MAGGTRRRRLELSLQIFLGAFNYRYNPGEVNKTLSVSPCRIRQDRD